MTYLTPEGGRDDGDDLPYVGIRPRGWRSMTYLTSEGGREDGDDDLCDEAETQEEGVLQEERDVTQAATVDN